MSLREYHQHQAQSIATQLEGGQGQDQRQDVTGPHSSIDVGNSGARLASTESQRASPSSPPAPTSSSASGGDTHALPPLPTTPPASTFPAQDPDTSSSTPTIRPPTSTITLPAGARPTPLVMQSSSSNANRSSGSIHQAGALPPPHALPKDSQPVVPQLNPAINPAPTSASEVPPPPPPRDAPAPAPSAQTQTQVTTTRQATSAPTLPPAPAHPALAIMRASSVRSRAEPRRALSVSRGPSGMHTSTLPSPDTMSTQPGVASGNGNPSTGYTYGPGTGTGNAYGSGNAYASGNPYSNNGAQKMSYYTSATSTTPEKDKDLSFFSDVDLARPTSPSGRPLRIDLPELHHQYPYSAPPTVGAAIRGVSGLINTANQYIENVTGNRDPRYAPALDEKYRDNSIYGAHAGVPTLPNGYNHVGYGTSVGYSTNQDMTGNRNGTGFYGAGQGGQGGQDGMAGSAYLNAYTEVGLPRVPRTVTERLLPTLETVERELAKSQRKAQMTGLFLNIAIGLQVVLSALITALSAVTSGRRTQVMTSVLGGAGTVVASYLARARGSNEPELSTARVKDLQRFQRVCIAFVEDCGHETGWEGHEGYQPPPAPSRYKPRSQNERRRLLGLGWCMGGIDDEARETGRGEEAGMENEKDEGVGNVPREWDGGVRLRELDERIRRLRAELEHLLGNGNGERKLSQV